MSDVLARPIWHALHTRQSGFAEGGALARRFQPEVSLFAAARDEGPEALEALSRLMPSGDSVILMQDAESPLPPGTISELAAQGVQMTCPSVVAPAAHETAMVTDLTADDAADMLELATLTKPGPFRLRTRELGQFVGIRIDGRLAAMAGERLKVPGFTEVSGVCTHPDARGRGYAGLLSQVVAARIMARGETPFLHAWASNTAAIRLYEKLGFVHRRGMAVAMIRKA